MAMHARPVPTNPYNPKNPNPNPNTSEGAGAVQYPSPFIPIRLPVFAPVLWINDRVVSLLNVAGGRRRPSSSLSTSANNTPNAGLGGSGLRMGRRRGMSDATVESVEEGTGDSGAAEAAQAAASAARRAVMGEFASGMGGKRKKAD